MLKIIVVVCACIFFLHFPRVYAGQKDASTGDVITATDNPKGWIIQAKSSVYQLVLTRGNKVQQVYYGSKEQSSFKPENSQWIKDMDGIPVRGATQRSCVGNTSISG